MNQQRCNEAVGAYGMISRSRLQPEEAYQFAVLQMRWLSYQREQVTRLKRRLVIKENELAISSEWGLSDCQLLSTQIQAMREELTLLTAGEPE